MNQEWRAIFPDQPDMVILEPYPEYQFAVKLEVSTLRSSTPWLPESAVDVVRLVYERVRIDKERRLVYFRHRGKP